MRQALAGKRFDVVFDNVYDWERGTTAAQVEATARACGDRLRRYIFMSSVAAYGDGLNHHEGDALAPDDHPDAYVRNKAMSERALFRLHQRTGFPVVTLRPPFVYGPGNPFYREAFFWDRLRDKRPIIMPGDGRRLMQFVYVKDLVWACLRAMEEPAAVGHAFNIANLRPVTQTEVVEAFAAAAAKKAQLVRVPRERILRAGRTSHGPAALLRRLLRSAAHHPGGQQGAAGPGVPAHRLRARGSRRPTAGTCGTTTTPLSTTPSRTGCWGWRRGRRELKRI